MVDPKCPGLRGGGVREKPRRSPSSPCCMDVYWRLHESGDHDANPRFHAGRNRQALGRGLRIDAPNAPTACFGILAPRLTSWSGPAKHSTAAFTCAPRFPPPSRARDNCSMPYDPARVAETKSWFEKVANDLRAAYHEITAAPPLTDDIVFHAQQAAEKAMKGYPRRVAV